MEKIMPDLFVVMSDDELKESIEYAREQGATHAKSLIAMNYDLFINGENMESYSEETGRWFPDFVEYISLPTETDEIGILLSPTIWNNYDEYFLYEVLRDNNISRDIIYDPLFIQPRKLMSFIEREKIISECIPVNSPWTARDFEVVESAIQAIPNIKKATILNGANFEISIYVKDFEDTNDEFVIAEEVSNKKEVERFSYPNVLHLDTEEGIFNVFMGSEINIRRVLNLLESKSIDTIIKDFEAPDKDLLLYASREESISYIKDNI